MPPEAVQELQRWVELSVACGREALDDVQNMLSRHCVGGAVIEERPPEIALQPSERVIVKGYLPVWDEQTRQRLEIALLLLSQNGLVDEPRVRILAPQDWAEAWKAHFPVQHIGERTVIAASWHEYANKPGEVVLRLDPGMAFGTGLHASTRLCVLAIEQRLQPAMRVLDLGTGSGVLAIACALQGAAEVQALDADPVAVEVARQNVQRNRVEGLVRVFHGTVGPVGGRSVPRCAARDYGLILVNILAETVIAMAPALAEALAPGGLVVGSGILVEKGHAVDAALTAAGLELVEHLQEESWLAIIARRS